MQPNAEPRAFPGQRRKRGTNYGLCNDMGNWLHIGPNIAAFNTAKAARSWLTDAAAQGKDQMLTFRYVHADALAQ